MLYEDIFWKENGLKTRKNLKAFGKNNVLPRIYFRLAEMGRDCKEFTLA